MSKEVDRKLQHVPIAEFHYRHEAELAAGFLSDAGIPYRLQSDDAGGADLGLSMLRPSVLWVRAVDVDAARELIALEEQAPERPMEASAPVHRHATTPDGPLSALERAVAGGLGVALLAVAPNLPPSPMRTSLTVLCYVGGFALIGAAAVGRAPGFLGGLIRMISGSPPR